MSMFKEVAKFVMNLSQTAVVKKRLIVHVASHNRDVNIDLPVKPKKPITPWVAFVRERKNHVLSQNEKMTAAQMAVILAKEWKTTDKSKYEREYNAMHDEYTRQLRDYQNSLTEEHRDYLNMKKLEKREQKAMKELKKTNIPVLPRNCANLYVQERCKHQDIRDQLKQRKASEVFSILFKEYRNLSQSEKQKYIDMQEEDRSRFQHDFLDWFEGVQNNDELSKTARELANTIHTRVKSLNYI